MVVYFSEVVRFLATKNVLLMPRIWRGKNLSVRYFHNLTISSCQISHEAYGVLHCVLTWDNMRHQWHVFAGLHVDEVN